MFLCLYPSTHRASTLQLAPIPASMDTRAQGTGAVIEALDSTMEKMGMGTEGQVGAECEATGRLKLVQYRKRLILLLP